MGPYNLLTGTTCYPLSTRACAAGNGLDALREELAGSAPAATREDKLAAALAKLL